MTATQELQEEILKTVRKGQEAVVDAIQTWADAVQAIKPPLPDLNIPFTDKLPQPAELVASAYDFAEQLLAAQRKFAEDALAAIAPVHTSEPLGHRHEEGQRRQVRPDQHTTGPDPCRGAGPAPSPLAHPAGNASRECQRGMPAGE